MLHQYAFPENLTMLLQATGVGLWHYDIDANMFYFNDTLKSVLSAGCLPFSGLVNRCIMSDGERQLLYNLLRYSNKTISFELDLEDVTLAFKGTFLNEKGYTGIVQQIGQNQNSNGYLLHSLIEQAPVATCLFVGPEMKIEVANEVMLSYWGKGDTVLGKPLAEALPELKDQPFLKILDRIYKTGEIHEEIEAEAQLEVNGVLGTYYFDYTYKPVRDVHGNIFGVMDMAVDVTDRVLLKKRKENSELRFGSVIEQSPMAIAFLMGKEMRIEMANNPMLKLWGRTEAVIGKTLAEVLPEVEAQGFLNLLNNVYTTGITYRGDDVRVVIEHGGVPTDVYVDFTYSVLRDNSGEINGVLVLANDISARVTAMAEIAASEEKFKAVIYSAQAAVAVFKSDKLIADIANDEFLRFVGRSRDEIIGKPLLESMPEIKGQESEYLMLEVLKTGTKIHHFGRQVNIVRNGVLTPNYYNVSYTPLYDAFGSIYGVLDMAIDVTETVKAQEALQEAEASLRGAIELAELGTWTLDPVKESVEYSDRIKEWLGFDGAPELLDESLDALHKVDRERIRNAVFKAINPEGEGVFNEEFRVINRVNGVERILHAVGKTFFDENGIPYLLTGTAQDITGAKKIQLLLETQVKERTLALQKANYELEDINQKLINTNKELEQYAYVASHDLQEPLRKINMFCNLLKEQNADNRNEVTISKIINASQRMSLLIKDLLEFSRLVYTDTRFVATDINGVVQSVLADFELLIEEKHASVVVQELPVIDAIPLQLSQLFYNLIGNALKFTLVNVPPVISISAKKLTQPETALYIKKPQPGFYYKIDVSDNGIGIDEKYQKQIFEVFKRLHSRSEYSGSGIGLAICLRVVTNHQGCIFVNSKVGSGTTFSIVLPAKPHI